MELSNKTTYDNEESCFYYKYPIKNFLVKDISLLSDLSEYSIINLCVYNINTSGKFPFIRYLLSNNYSSELNLPVLPLSSLISIDNIVSYSKVFLSGMLNVDNFQEFSEKTVFEGFYEYYDTIYLFFDITGYELSIDESDLSSNARLALIDEITNHRSICNKDIGSHTTRFFTDNPSLNILYNKKNEPIEIPIVGFVGKSNKSKVNFVYTFGESAKDRSSILGPHFYFTDLHHAIKQAHNSNSNEGGIIRFALFTGRTKYIENMPNDPNDESQIKRERLEDPSLDRKREILTLRVSDHDGMWSKSYDSAYLGNIELDDGTTLDESYILALKDYNQQLPLSFHYLKNIAKMNSQYELLFE